MDVKGFFSLKFQAELVKKKLEVSKTITLKELAAYLITLSPATLTETQERGITRRIYEIIHVFTAVGLVSQEKKVIRWLGFPHQREEDTEEKALLSEKERILHDIQLARSTLADLHEEIRLYSTLSERNLNKEPINPEEKLPLPFITITTNQPSTAISVNEDDTEYWIDVSMPFDIKDDVEVLKRLL